MFTSQVKETLGLQLLAWDCVNLTQRPQGSLPRYAESPMSGMTVDMTHPQIIQHRLFNMLDGNADGVINEEDVRGWMQLHVRVGVVTWDAVMDVKFLNHGGYREEEHGIQSEGQVWGWLEGMVWGLMKEAFEPQSSHPDWKVNSPVPGYHIMLMRQHFLDRFTHMQPNECIGHGCHC